MQAICTFCMLLEGGINCNLTLREDILQTVIKKNNKLILNNEQRIGVSSNNLSTTMVNAVELAFANTIDALGYKKLKVIKRWYSYQPVTFSVRLHAIIVKAQDKSGYEIYSIRNDFTSYTKVGSMKRVIKILKGLSNASREDNAQNSFSSFDNGIWGGDA